MSPHMRVAPLLPGSLMLWERYQRLQTPSDCAVDPQLNRQVLRYCRWKKIEKEWLLPLIKRIVTGTVWIALTRVLPGLRLPAAILASWAVGFAQIMVVELPVLGLAVSVERHIARWVENYEQRMVQVPSYMRLDQNQGKQDMQNNGQWIKVACDQGAFLGFQFGVLVWGYPFLCRLAGLPMGLFIGGLYSLALIGAWLSAKPCDPNQLDVQKNGYRQALRNQLWGATLYAVAWGGLSIAWDLVILQGADYMLHAGWITAYCSGWMIPVVCGILSLLGISALVGTNAVFQQTIKRHTTAPRI